jgi:hypothetical protein
VKPYPSDHRAVVATVSILAVADKEADKTSLKVWRKSAVDRRRRIIFNNDGNEPVSVIKRPSKQDFLDARTSALANAHVDSISYCTAYGGFGVFNHFTKIGHPFVSKEGRYADNQMEAFLKAGIDPLRVMIDFCKKSDIEIFWSMRMNDTHDGSRSDYGPIMLGSNPLKAEHPEYLLGTATERPKHGSWTGMDYGRPEVRDLAFRFVEEVCKNYDIDGVELDFFRHPVFLKSVSRGERATEEEIDGMTGLMKRIRTMADEVGRKRGRPILIAVKAPDSIEYAKAIGLDIERWMAGDLIDLYIPGGYFQLNDWKTSIALGHKYGVKVYPSLDEPRLKDATAQEMRAASLGYRGRAAEAWDAGADGVYLFNFFDPHAGILREIGDPKKLASLDKDYFACVRGVGNAAGGNLPFEKFQNIETLNPGNPKSIAPGEKGTARIEVADGQEQIKTAKLALRLRFDDAPSSEHLSISLNGVKLQSPVANGQWVEYHDVANAIREGTNEVEVSLLDDAQQETVWSDLMLQVRSR